MDIDRRDLFPRWVSAQEDHCVLDAFETVGKRWELGGGIALIGYEILSQTDMARSTRVGDAFVSLLHIFA